VPIGPRGRKDIALDRRLRAAASESRKRECRDDTASEGVATVEPARRAFRVQLPSAAQPAAPRSETPAVIGCCLLSSTISRSSLPTLKNGKRFEGTATDCPVRGLRPVYAL